MKINKYKKVGKNKYKVYFDNNEIILFEDVILKYDLLLLKDVSLELLDKIIDENKFYEAYDMSLSYIETKMRNRKEIYKYLKKKGYEEELINKVIDKLTSLKILDDRQYISAFINDKINLSNDGPFKIKKLLLELDFNESDIDNYLNNFNDSLWEEKLINIVNKKKNLMNNKSYYMFITKLKNDLFNLGYDKYMIDNILSNIKYESNALEKDFNSDLKKYKDDKNKLINYLLRKGYSYDEINTKLKNLV